MKTIVLTSDGETVEVEEDFDMTKAWCNQDQIIGEHRLGNCDNATCGKVHISSYDGDCGVCRIFCETCGLEIGIHHMPLDFSDLVSILQDEIKSEGLRKRLESFPRYFGELLAEFV